MGIQEGEEVNIWDLSDKDLKIAAKRLKEENKTWPKELRRLERSELSENHKFYEEEKGLIEVWRSKDFLCQIYEREGTPARLSIIRCAIDTTNRRWRDGITWDEMQQIKREVGRGNQDAVEIFPRDDDEVNVANVRHLWLVAPETIPFAWRPGRKREPHS